ncbi:MAG: hypothetical protein KGO79_03385 [Betaproteobacteria bacterium]|nr:hypothetical protein [Betaproteobacteria bacterium]
MSEDIERTLDEILTGVNALLAEAPASAPGGMPASLSPPPEEQAQWDESLPALLAMVEAQRDHPAAALAARLASRWVQGRAVPLGNLLPQQPHLRVSPMLPQRFKALTGQGGRLISCDAQFSLWDFSQISFERVTASLSRLSAVLCPDQAGRENHWRIPHYPERCSLKWISGQAKAQGMQFSGAAGYAVIDMDNIAIPLSTLLWIEDIHFVPDFWCAMAFNGQSWCPVIQRKG